MKIMRPFYYNVNCGRIYRFYKKHIKTTKVYRDSDALRTVIQEYKLDAVIVGSDQVWRLEDTRGVGYNFFLDFADDNVLKMSYAASYGTDEWKGTENDNKIIKNLRQRPWEAQDEAAVHEEALAAGLYNLTDQEVEEILNEVRNG